MHREFTKSPLMRLFLSSFFILMIAQNSMASIFFEPYVGYEMGDQKQNTTSYDEKGLNMGFRLGYLVSGPLYLGFEYVLADLTVDRPGATSDVKTSDWGFLLGGTISVVRLWATYWMSSEGNSHNPNTDYKGDAGYKLGLGFNIVSQVNFNVEKSSRVWRRADGNKMTHEIEMDGFILSLSLPFTF